MAGLLLGSNTGLSLGDKSPGFQLGPSLTCCVTQEKLLFCLGYSVPHKEKTILLPLLSCESSQWNPLAKAEGKPATWWPPAE